MIIRPSISLIGIALFFQVADAYTPNDPPVVALVDRLVATLEKNLNEKSKFIASDPHEGGLGEEALAGYAHLKTRHDPANAVVRQGVQAASAYARVLGRPTADGGHDKSVYSAAVCALMLAELDAEKYRSELNAFASYLSKVQKSHGGFGYRSFQTGDVSQTQYAALALWQLDRLGLNVDMSGVQQMGEWLIAVQDSGGGWPYQGAVPNSGGRVRQSGVTESMAVAGGSALMIAGDVLRVFGDGGFSDIDDPNVAGLPEAIRLPVKMLGSRRKVSSATLPKNKIIESINLCDEYLKGDPKDGVHDGDYPFYKLYTTERYESFKTVVFEQEEESEPDWYSDGVNYIMSEAKGDSFRETRSHNTSTNAAFCLLFLVRSTKAAIDSAKVGSAIGGWGLPEDTSNVNVDGGQIKGKAIASSVTDLLSVLESDGADDLAGKSIPDNLQLAEAGKERQDQLDRLERLARGSQSWQARRVAMRLLAQSDDMDRVPALIYGLSDPDSKVKLYARDGLRFISRRFDGFGLGRKPNEGEVYAAQQKWKSWFLTMRPEHVFLD